MALTPGLVEPQHLAGIPSHLALEIFREADEARIGERNRAYWDELFFPPHACAGRANGGALRRCNR